MSAITDRLVIGGYEAGWSAIRHMPERAAYRMFQTIADEQWLQRGKSVRRLESNLRRVLGPDVSDRELRQVSRAGMRSYMRYYCDAFRLPGWSRERIVSRFKAEDQHLADALATGKGAVATLPHMGNWDHAGAWANLTHQQVTSVAERLKPEEVYEKFLDYRRAIGIEVLPLTGGDVPVFDTLADRLRGGGLVALLGDRDLTSRGVEVQFFGATTKLPAGPAALAIQTGAALLPASLWYDGPNAHVRIYAPVPVPEVGTQREKVAAMTQQVASCFEQGVREHPEDWHMLQRLWLDDLDPSRSAREA